VTSSAGGRAEPPAVTTATGRTEPPAVTTAAARTEPLAVTGAAGDNADGPAIPDRSAGETQLPDHRIALTALTLAAAVLVAEGYLAAGAAGFVAAATALALLAILAARAMMPRGERPPPSAVRKKQQPAGSSESVFPAYRKITSDLSWAGVSRRHYDHGLRPQLARLLDARLARRYGPDAAAQPEQARELVGAELWPLVDASRPASNDSRAPGVSLATLDRIVTRLEEL
jgi:hypothetical protein